MRRLILAAVVGALCACLVETSQLCRSTLAQQNCGQCLKQHPDCGWCTDPDFDGAYRCDSGDNLKNDGACREQHVYHPKLELEFPQNRKIGDKNSRDQMTQLQPQQVRLRMKPGEKADFEIFYLHLDDAKNVYILNSEVVSQGLDVEYKVRCKEGDNFIPGDQCQNVQNNVKVEFKLTITLKECKTKGDAVMSVGVSNHPSELLAVYITPMCGCDCEKFEQQEQRSQHCSGRGTLICGSCVCDSGFEGKKCDCRPGESEANEDKCRENEDADVCSGHGYCSCGACSCEKNFEGVFCECDNSQCPIHNGQQCSGNGQCACGDCVCAPGWTGKSCECTTSKKKCVGNSGKACNAQGKCKCGVCECNKWYGGQYCEERLEGVEGEPEPEMYDDEAANDAEASTEPEGSSSIKPIASIMPLVLVWLLML